MQGQPTGQGGMNQQSFMSSQPTGFQGQQGTGNMSFLNNPPPAGSFGQQSTGGGYLGAQPTGMGFGGNRITPQMTGYPGGGASGLLPQQTGFPGGGGLMSQPTGYGGGLTAQPTGFGLRAQPTGFQDPRLASMMQSFMPSNVNQVCRGFLHCAIDNSGPMAF